MGCDYYTITKVIFYTTTDDFSHELSKERGYLLGTDDFDDDAPKQDLPSTERKTLYENGKWNIANQDKIDEYKAMVTAVEFDQITKIEKVRYSVWR